MIATAAQMYFLKAFHVPLPAGTYAPGTQPATTTGGRPTPVTSAPAPAPAPSGYGPIAPVQPVAARPTAPVPAPYYPTPLPSDIAVTVPVPSRPTPVKPLSPQAPTIGDTSGHTAPANNPGNTPTPAVPTPTTPAPTVGDAATAPRYQMRDQLNIDRQASDVGTPSSDIAASAGTVAAPAAATSTTVTLPSKHLIGYALIALLALLLVIHAARR